jgi:pyridoxine/pyridoxamine 5'-phosphate oxidase
MSGTGDPARLPSFYNDLDETLAESWGLIARGVQDRRSPFHHPTLATLGADGRPRLRTLILRGCDAPGRTLRLHTDARSEKVSEIRQDPRVGLHFYDPTAKIQLRIDGSATLNTDNAIADAAWAGSRLMSRQCYGIAPGPGTAIDAADAFALPETSDAGTAPGRANFCSITIRIESLEWLYLAVAGHRRALFRWPDERPQAGWLAP